MNNRQKEVQKIYLDNEEKVLKDLKKIYQDASDQIDEKIAALMGRTDTENIQSITYQLEYQKALKKQIDGILDTMDSEQFTTVSGYLGKCYEDGFVGTMYDLHGQGIPLTIPIDQEQVEYALVKDTKLSKPLYESMGKNTTVLKRKVSSSISRGFATGSSYIDIAADINRQSKIGLNKAMRVARTEGHRVQMTASMDATNKAKEKGADIVKQWDATLDSRTRNSHARVDGEIREIDKPFSNGLMFPGDPKGAAAEVINCRCALLQRAKWALDEDELKILQKRAEYFGLDKTDNFNDFKKKYLDNSENAIYNGNAINNNDNKLSKYVGQEIKAHDNKSVREWYDANVHSIPNQIDTTKSIEEQAQQAFELRNKYKREAREAMSDKETVAELEKKRPAPTFEELVQSKMKRKGMTREETIEDILKTASKTNKDVDELFGL